MEEHHSYQSSSNNDVGGNHATDVHESGIVHDGIRDDGATSYSYSRSHDCHGNSPSKVDEQDDCDDDNNYGNNYDNNNYDDDASLTLVDVRVSRSNGNGNSESEFALSSVTFNLSNPYFTPQVGEERRVGVAGGDFAPAELDRVVVAAAARGCDAGGGGGDTSNDDDDEDGFNLSRKSRDIESLIGDASLQGIYDDGGDGDDDGGNGRSERGDLLRRLLIENDDCEYGNSFRCDVGGSGVVEASSGDSNFGDVSEKKRLSSFDFSRGEVSKNGKVDSDAKSSFDANQSELYLLGAEGCESQEGCRDGETSNSREKTDAKKGAVSNASKEMYSSSRRVDFGFDNDESLSSKSELDRSNRKLSRREDDEAEHFIPKSENANFDDDDDDDDNSFDRDSIVASEREDSRQKFKCGYRRSSSTTVRWKNTGRPSSTS